MPASPLGFRLPWEGLEAGGQALQGLGGDPQQAMAALGPMYAQQYSSALGMNKALHENVQSNYGQLRSEADQVYQNIYSNLDQRYGDVLGRLAGTNSSNIRDIEANARAQSAASTQSLINRGLGNTTVMNSANRGINSDRTRETTRSNEAFGQLQASAADRIWQDRTNTQQNKIGTMANLGMAQNSALERVNAGYPDAGMYGSLASMYGAQSEADKNRKLQEAAMQRAGAGVQSSGGYSYSPSPWGSRNPAGSGGGAFAGDSWTGNNQGMNYGGYGGGGGFYQPQGGNFTTPQNYGDGGDFDPSMQGGGAYDPSYYESAGWGQNLAADEFASMDW